MGCNDNNNHRQGVIICRKCDNVYGCVDNLKILFCCQCNHEDACQDKLYKHEICRDCGKLNIGGQDESKK